MNRLPECEQFAGRLCDICNGVALVEGEPMNPEHITIWRANHALAPIGQDQDEWNVTMKSRGLGDVVAKITHATGIHAAVQAVTTAAGLGCGCGQRQDALNKLLPLN